MDSNIQTQLNELKATLEAIRIGIGVLEARLDQDAQEPEPTEQERADFDAWCNAFDQRWRDRPAALQSHAWGDTECNGPLCTEHGDARDTSVLS